ncbi:MAG TPA: alpha/beta hydrolase [Cyclobacteriaceae bacterium]|nr:alpha/beta hydrolase [Cyclobacteriaceae bacterium]
MNKKIIYFTFPIILIGGLYFLGPEPDRPQWDPAPIVVPQAADDLERYITDQESKHRVKPDNEARIVWADSSRKKTPFSIVYLHGFSASQAEGDPVHKEFARRYGCNLYLARLADHGIDTTEQLLYFTPDRWWRSSREALAIGKAIGDRVIVMSTSTGSTMALILAATYPEDVYAIMNMSPNIAINDDNAHLVNDPWGLQIARLVVGGKSRVIRQDSVINRYWNNPYRMEAVVQLQEMLEDKMTPATFAAVHCPSVTLYYYKSEQEQDRTVKVSAMKEMHGQLATPDSLKEIAAIPGAGGHVLGSYLVSKDIPAVSAAFNAFAEKKLRLKARGE